MQHGLKYHIAPPYGLLNDPNGLVQFKGKYHVFFQWNQDGVTHANKSWGHRVSTDLIHWETLPVAMEPVDWFDKNGVYSGSAIVHNDTLYLFYTGNVKDENDTRFTYQCLATSTDGIHFKKHGPLFEYPKGYTAHVRDPKVWFDAPSQKWHMLLGAQLENETGDTILYTSSNLTEWTFEGSILQFEQPLGYMWECPDLIFLTETRTNQTNDLTPSDQEQAVFIFSPQGLSSNGHLYHNIHQTCYVIGQYDKGKFTPQQDMVEMDRGFEFYAPQTFVSDDKRVIQYAWMGMMEPEKEETMPTLSNGWIHHLSVPRELTLQNGHLYQYPVRELELLRHDEMAVTLNGNATIELPSLACDIVVETTDASFEWRIRDEVVIAYDATENLMSVERTNWSNQTREIRRCVLNEPLQKMRLLLESSCMELFINDGYEVFSLRYFADESNIQMQTTLNGTMTLYQMA